MMEKRNPYVVNRIGLDRAVDVNADGIVRVHGLPVCRRVNKPSGVVLQFKDRNRWRSTCRGTEKVEVALSDLVEALT